MKTKIKKVIFNQLSELPPNKGLLLHDMACVFYAKTGKDIEDYWTDYEAVVNELETADYARFEKLPNKMVLITKGIDFDVWSREMRPDKPTSHFSISALNAHNVQVGNENTMNVNVTPDQFLAALENMQNNPKKAKSILSTLSEELKKGLSIGETIAKFIALIG